MKKFLAGFLVSLLILAVALPSTAASLPAAKYAAEGQTQWTMGFKKNVNTMTKGVQGSNGWYALYTTQTNRNGSFDLSQMKTSTWGATANCWKYWVSYNWSPSIYLQSGYDFSGNSNWWLQDGNGRMDTNVAKGVVSGAYAWAAPKDGNYKVSVSYTAGGGNEEYDGVAYYAEDGVTLSINTKSGVLSRANCPATTAKNPNLTTGSMAKTISLKAGELVYFIVDPQKSGSYDCAQLSIDITTTEEEPDEEEKDNSGSGNGDGTGSGNESGSGSGNGTGTTGGGEDKNGSGSGSGTGNGSGDGTGKGSGTGQAGGTGNSSSGTMRGMPSLSVPSSSTNTTEGDTEDTKEGDEGVTDTSSLLELAGEDLENLDNPAEQTDETDSDSSGSEEAAAQSGGGSGNSEIAEDETTEKKTSVLFIVGLIEAMASGIVLSAGKFYFYA